VIHSLPKKLRISQDIFDQTGGLHASALFDAEGNLELVREDVGRHNALDKVIGEKFLAGDIPLDERVLMVSGSDSHGTPVTVRADAPIEEVVSTMEYHQVRRVPVVDENGCCIGIISQADVASVGRTGQVAELVREVSKNTKSG